MYICTVFATLDWTDWTGLDRPTSVQSSPVQSRDGPVQSGVHGPTGLDCSPDCGPDRRSGPMDRLMDWTDKLQNQTP